MIVAPSRLRHEASYRARPGEGGDIRSLGSLVADLDLWALANETHRRQDERHRNWVVPGQTFQLH